jgi:bleomycin hydrolase
MLSTSIAISPRPRQNREPSSGPAARRSLLRVVSGARGAGALVAALVVLLVALLPVPTAVAPATAAAADTGTSPHLVTPELGPRAPDGGLPGDLIDRLRSTRLEGERKALADIVANGDLSKVALNRERYIAHNPLVSFRIDSGEITAQKASGRCWMFAGFNALRPEVLRKLKLKKFEFSENYLEFWDKMEKANFHLQEMIDLADRPLEDRYVEIVLHDPLGDGGWWSYFVDLVRKYGAVPKEVMPETHNSSSTHLMNKLVTLKLKQFGLELRDLARSGAKPDRLRQRKEEMLGEIYEMLALNLGRPPETFTWRYATSDSTEIVTWPETLTPRKFFDEVVGIDLDSYVSLFNYPGKEMLQPYSIELSRNLYDRPDFTFLNVPIDTLRACVLSARRTTARTASSPSTSTTTSGSTTPTSISRSRT